MKDQRRAKSSRRAHGRQPGKPSNDPKHEITPEGAADVVRVMRKLAALLEGAPTAVSRKEACVRLGCGMRELNARIARGEILTCIHDPTRIPMSEVRVVAGPLSGQTSKKPNELLRATVKDHVRSRSSAPLPNRVRGAA